MSVTTIVKRSRSHRRHGSLAFALVLAALCWMLVGLAWCAATAWPA